MESMRRTGSASLWPQKDYSKLEMIFASAVEKSRERKIIHYGSQRLYSNEFKKALAKQSLRQEARLKPANNKDIHTTMISITQDITSPQEVRPEDLKQILSVLKGAPTSEKENQKAVSVLSAYQAVQNNEGFKLSSLLKAFDTEDQTKENKSFDEFYTVEDEQVIPIEKPSEEITKEIQLEKPEEEEALNKLRSQEIKDYTYQPKEITLEEEAVEQLITESQDRVAQQRSTPKVVKSEDYKKALYLFITSIILLGIFVIAFYNQFVGYDYIACILAVISIFIAWDMKAKRLIYYCAIVLALLIICMIIYVTQTLTPIPYFHYAWFLIIPICLTCSYYFIEEKRGGIKESPKEEDKQIIEIETEDKVEAPLLADVLDQNEENLGFIKPSEDSFNQKDHMSDLIFDLVEEENE